MIKNREKGFTMRKRRLALFLVFALALGVAPVTKTSLAKSGEMSKFVWDVTEEAKNLLKDIYEVDSTTGKIKSTCLLGIKFSDITNFDNKLSQIANTYHLGNIDTATLIDLSSKEVVCEAQRQPVEKANLIIYAFTSLIDLRQKAVAAVVAISDATSNYIGGDGATYNQFCTAVETASGKLEEYNRQFSYLSNQEMMISTLVDTSDVAKTLEIRDSRISNLDGYKDALKKYNIEKAYRNMLNIFKPDQADFTFSDSYDPNMDEFQTVLTENGIDQTGSSILILLYNGSEIKALLESYNRIKTIKMMLKALPDEKVETKAEIDNLIKVQNLYKDLSETDKSRVPEVYLNKLTRLGTSISEITDTTNAIAAISYPTSDETYKTFKTNYETAYAYYAALVAKFGANSGVDQLVTNISEFLGDMTKVKDLLERVNEIIAIDRRKESNTMLNSYAAIEGIVTDYKALSTQNQSRIYSYPAFYTIYQDATAAYKLRLRVDKLLLRLTPDEADKAEIQQIRKDYAALNKMSQAYFGELYLKHLEELEYGTYAQSQALATRVEELIDRIGKVNSNSRSKIEAAEDAYNNLTDYQKQIVKNYATLVAARSAYNSLKNDISAATVTCPSYYYKRSAICPNPTVKVDGVILTKGVHYTLSYSNNVNAGTAYVTITSISGSGYVGSYKKAFTIVRRPLTNATITNIKTSYKYTGKAIKPTPKVKYNSVVLKKGRDYKVSYSNNKKKGTATVKVTGIGNYSGTKTKKFKIRK